MSETIQLDVQLFANPRRATIAAAVLEVIRSDSKAGAIVNVRDIVNSGVFKAAIDSIERAIDGDVAAPKRMTSSIA